MLVMKMARRYYVDRYVFVVVPRERKRSFLLLNFDSEKVASQK